MHEFLGPRERGALASQISGLPSQHAERDPGAALGNQVGTGRDEFERFLDQR
jgi:hypothetical protein